MSACKTLKEQPEFFEARITSMRFLMLTFLLVLVLVGYGQEIEKRESTISGRRFYSIKNDLYSDWDEGVAGEIIQVLMDKGEKELAGLLTIKEFEKGKKSERMFMLEAVLYEHSNATINKTIYRALGPDVEKDKMVPVGYVHVQTSSIADLNIISVELESGDEVIFRVN